MLKYAIAEGLPYAGLTNGDCWELYDVFKRVPLTEKRIINISIQNDSVHPCALNLLSFWRPNLSSDKITKAHPPIIRPDPPPPTPAPPWESLAEHKLNSKNRTCMVRFWDGSEIEMSYIKDLPRKIVEILYNQGNLSKNDLPYTHGKHFCINTKPTYPNGRLFRKTEFGTLSGTSIYFGCGLTTSQIQKYSITRLKHFRKDPSKDVLFNLVKGSE